MQYQDMPFRSVEGIPRGGVPLAKALEKYATGKEEHQPMIVDDIYTTGKSFDDYMEEHYPCNLHAWGHKWVVFQRGPTMWIHIGVVKSLFKGNSVTISFANDDVLYAHFPFSSFTYLSTTKNMVVSMSSTLALPSRSSLVYVKDVLSSDLL